MKKPLRWSGRFSNVYGGLRTHADIESLEKNQIETPTVHLNSMGIKTPAKQTETPYAWSARTVADILAKVEYLGHTVNFKTRKNLTRVRRRFGTIPKTGLCLKTHMKPSSTNMSGKPSRKYEMVNVDHLAWVKWVYSPA